MSDFTDAILRLARYCCPGSVLFHFYFLKNDARTTQPRELLALTQLAGICHGCMKRYLPILTLLLICPLFLFGQTLVKFDYSECMQECIGDIARIDSIYRSGDVTVIEITAYANCVGNLEGSVMFIGDTLNLDYSIKGTIEVDPNTGEEMEVVEVLQCDCIFKFHYRIAGIGTLDRKRIKINGETIDEHNARYRFEEIVIDVGETGISESPHEGNKEERVR